MRMNATYFCKYNYTTLLQRAQELFLCNLYQKHIFVLSLHAAIAVDISVDIIAGLIQEYDVKTVEDMYEFLRVTQDIIKDYH